VSTTAASGAGRALTELRCVISMERISAKYFYRNRASQPGVRRGDQRLLAARNRSRSARLVHGATLTYDPRAMASKHAHALSFTGPGLLRHGVPVVRR